MEERARAKAKKAGKIDHEYEPISPPPGPPVGPPAVHVTNIEGVTIQEPPEGPDAEPIMTDTDSVGSPVRRPVEEMPVPLDGVDEDRAMSGGEMGDTNGSLGGPEDEVDPEADDEFMTAAQMQQRMEDRFFAPTPTPVRTESRTTDAERNTSNVDSSGLKDLPLTKQGRKSKAKSLFAGSARPGKAVGVKGRWGRLSGGSSGTAGASGSGSQPDDAQRPESIQQRLRSGADRLKTRLSGISRPKLPAVKRPKFHLPDKAKFHLPERPKFKMPERPKFKMPERPKLSLGGLGRGGASGASGASGAATSSAEDSENKPQTSRAGGKRPLKGRQYSTESTAGSSEKRKPLFDLTAFRTYPRMFRRGKHRDGSSSSPRSARSARSARPATPPPRASFSSDTAKWMRRFSEAKYGAGDPSAAAMDYAAHHSTPPPEATRRPPAAAQATLTANGDQMVYHISLHGSDSEPDYSDDQFQGPPYPEITPIDGDLAVVDHAARKALAEARATAEAEAAREAQRQARLQAEHEAAEAAAVQMEMEYRRQQQQPQRFDRYADQEEDAEDYSQDQDAVDSDRENRSSGTSSERHRQGVIEEIDSDEFFLRQKGISQEDVDVGRYISSEIRDALRERPPAGYGEEVDDEESTAAPSVPPPRPQRHTASRSLARKKKQGKIYVPARVPRDTPPRDEDEEDEWDEDESRADESYFNTFPPDRPARRLRGKKKAVPATPPPPEQDQLDDEDLRIQEEIEFSLAIQRQDMGILALTPILDDDRLPPPLPPKRLRKSRSSNLNVNDDVPMIDGEDDDWGNDEQRVERHEVIALQNEAEYIIPRAPRSAPEQQQQQQQPPQTPPVPPTRGRRSRGGSRAGSRLGSRGTSLADEDRTSRGAESLPSERGDELPDDGLPPRVDDYAVVDKQNSLARAVAPPKPDRPRRPKPPRPPAPGRRNKRAPTTTATARLQNWRQFFSLPTRRRNKQAAAPVRPARNYSTLGPARPPRRGSEGSRHATTVYTASYLEVDDEHLGLDYTENESSRADLQSGEVISRMKDRPLPAPPRPSRSRKHRDKGDLDAEVDEQCVEKVVPERHACADEAQQLTYEERKAALAQMRDDFFSRSGEEPRLQEPDAEPMATGPSLEDERPPLTDSPYKSLRKKKKIPPLPPPEPEPEPEEDEFESGRPEEVSIAIQTDPLPDGLCVEDALPAADDATTSASRTWPTVVEHVQHVQAEAPPPPPPPPARRPQRDPQEAASVHAVPASVRLEVPESLQTQRLSVADLDVDRLSVSELRANKITVSEIDGVSLSVSEVHRGGLALSPGEPGSVELPSDLLQQLLPLSQSMSHALSQSLSESLAQSVSQALSQIQDALSQPAELVHQQQVLQQQLQRLQELQQQQQQRQNEQIQQQQEFQQQQQQLAQDTLLQVEQQHATVLHELQQQLQQLQLSAAQHPDVPPPIPPPPRVDAQQSIQTQTSLELPPPSPSPAPVAPPRGGARPRTGPASPSTALGDSEEDEELVARGATHSHAQHRFRRHHAHKAPRYSSDEDEAVSVAPRRHRPHGPDAAPGLAEAGRQLARACLVSSTHALAVLHQAARPALDTAMDAVGRAVGADPKRRDLQAALCLVLVLVAALVLLGCGCAGSNVVHHHHWDFQYPPPL